MTPESTENLDQFLEGYTRHGRFAIVPGILPSATDAEPEFSFERAIEKRALIIKNAADVAENDFESLALYIRNLSGTP